MSAPAGNVLPEGTYEFEFKGRKLHGYVTEWSDERQQRVAVHQFDRVGGGKTEWMERAPRRTSITLVFADATGFADADAFVRDVDKNPSGLFIHPIFGKSQRTCLGIQGGRLTASEANVYTMPVSFVENNVDDQQAAKNAQGVSGKAGMVASAADELVAFIGTL